MWSYVSILFFPDSLSFVSLIYIGLKHEKHLLDTWIKGYIAILLCKLILVGHAFLLCELMLLNFDACSIREHNHQMATNIFLLSTNLGWTMGKQLLPQTVKASKYICTLLFSTYCLWKKATCKVYLLFLCRCFICC